MSRTIYGRLRPMRTLLRNVFLAGAIALTAATGAVADRVMLNDGRVLEGEIIRETEGFLYVRVLIGDIGKDELVLRSDIKSIERVEAEKVDSPRRPAAAADDWSDADVDVMEHSDGSVRVAFITLEEMVGPFMYAPALKDAVDAIADDDIDVVILRINSGGGALVEIEPLIDVIEDEIKPKYRVAAWIESAISAAAMTGSICEEIYFMSEGNMGAATGFSTDASGKATRMDGIGLEQVLRWMGEVSERGQKDPLIMRAMQVPTNLSADIAADGSVVWRNDLDGEYIVSTEDGILTFDSQTAIKFKYAQGIADTKDELMRVMGISDWVEAGRDGDRSMVEHRETMARGQVEAGRIWQLFNIAANNGEMAQARRYLSQFSVGQAELGR